MSCNPKCIDMRPPRNTRNPSCGSEPRANRVSADAKRRLNSWIAAENQLSISCRNVIRLSEILTSTCPPYSDPKRTDVGSR